MTYSPIDARARLLMAVDDISDAIEKLEREALDLEAHDQAASVAIREHVALIRSSASQVANAAKHICESRGSVVN